MDSHQITGIQVSHGSYDGRLDGLVFYTGKNEIARIGSTHKRLYLTTTHMITLARDEVWCGVTSSDDRYTWDFQIITARLM